MKSNIFTGHNTKVLRQTSIGRKRKLSNYRSKNDIFKKKHRIINQRNIGFNQNYVKIEYNSSDDEDINITDSDQSSIHSDELNYCDDSDDGEMNVNNETSRILNIVIEEEPSVINHTEKCLEKLKTSKLLEKLTAILDESGQLSDFMHLLEYLADKTFPCRNIVFVLLME